MHPKEYDGTGLLYDAPKKDYRKDTSILPEQELTVSVALSFAPVLLGSHVFAQNLAHEA